MEQLGIDFKLLIAQIINFVLFFIIFKKYLASPFTSFLNKERKDEKEREALLVKIKKEDEDLTVNRSKLKDQMKKEVDILILEAKKTAENLKKELIMQARKEAEEIKLKASKQLADERQKLHVEVKEKMAEMSVLIVNKALNEFLDEESKKRITQHILKNLGKNVVYEN